MCVIIYKYKDFLSNSFRHFQLTFPKFSLIPQRPEPFSKSESWNPELTPFPETRLQIKNMSTVKAGY